MNKETGSFDPREAEPQSEKQNGILRKLMAWMGVINTSALPRGGEQNALPKEAEKTLNELNEVRKNIDRVVAEIEESNPSNTENQEISQKSLERIGKEWKPGQSLSYENIVFVRCTDHMPYIDEHGVWVLTPDKATNGELPRMTTHWTANHVVEPVNNVLTPVFDWSERRVVILAPGKDLVETNGKPESLLEVDSFWDHSLKLPAGTVIITSETVSEEQRVVLDHSGITLLQVAEGELASVKAKAAIGELGYTMLEGGTHGSSDQYVEKAFRSFSQTENVARTEHAGTPIFDFEKSLLRIDGNTADSVKESFFMPSFTPGILIQALQDPARFGGDSNRVKNLVMPRMKRLVRELLPAAVERQPVKGRDLNIDDRKQIEALFKWITTDPVGMQLLESIAVPTPPKTLDEVRTKSETILDFINYYQVNEFNGFMYHKLWENRLKLPTAWQQYMQAAVELLLAEQNARTQK